MTSFALSHAAIWKRFEAFWELLAPSHNRPIASDDSQKDARARRDLFLETLNRNTDAFQSELDVQNMMLSYPGRF